MKSYHLLIVAGACISLDTKFYKVAIGTGLRDIRCCQFLSDFAAAQGHYFERWSHETNLFLEKIAESLSQQLHELPFHKINVSDLVAFIKRHRDTPKIPPMSRSAAFARQILDPAALFQRQINVLRKAEAKQRNKPKAKSVSTRGKVSPMNDRPSTDGHQV